MTSAALACGCAFADETPKVQPKLPTVAIQLGTQTVVAEQANTPKTREIGLMGRKSMGQNEGMLFVFEQRAIQCMWMQNTLIDLDVAFMNEDGQIINVETMKAGTRTVHCSKGLSNLALEMNKDWFKNNGVRPGDAMKPQARN